MLNTRRSNMYKEYLEKTGGAPIPLYEIMGNKNFDEKFNRDVNQVYEYCIENNTTWEEALDFKFDPNVYY